MSDRPCITYANALYFDDDDDEDIRGTDNFSSNMFNS